MTLVIGCSTGCSLKRAISYPLTEADRLNRGSPIPLRLLIANLKDSRHNREKVGRADGSESTRDKFYKDVPGDVTKVIATHLSQSGLFADVQIAPFGMEHATPEQLTAVVGRFDAVLLGELGHFYGVVYRSSAMAGMAGVAGAAGGLVGGLVVVGIESTLSKDVEAHVLLRNLQLVSVNTGEIIWRGEVESSFKRSQRGMPDPPELAIEALRGAVAGLVERLNEANLQSP